ncbi:hypothetical protein K2P47_00545 [Patescibacteria group bacterium]|nr:hypothetical protein [Patescibacteria group bacterium]
MPPTSNEPQKTVHDQSKLQPFSFQPKKNVIIITIIGIVAIALVAFISLALIANDSTPDQKLYGFKTSVVEKVIRATKLSDSSKLEYSTALLENRVAELLVLYYDQSTSSPETLDRIASLTQQHTGDSVWMIENTNSLSPQEKILALAYITNTTRAFETLTDDFVEFDSIKDYSSDIQNIGQDSLKREVENFASTSDATAISAFTGEQIAIVGEEIKTVAQNSRAQTLALTRVDEAGEYISEARFGDAIYALMRARQAIAVDRYLYANERGEGASTETYDPGEVPAGS